MHVDDVAARLEIIVPGGLQQHRARDDLAGVADQLFQQEEFATLKVDQPSRSRHSPADRVELKVAYPQDRAATGAVGPAAKRLEARQKLREHVGLGEVIVAPSPHCTPA